jgi:hypothetical protein
LRKVLEHHFISNTFILYFNFKKAQLFVCIFDGGTYGKDALCTAVQMCRVAAKSASLRLDNYEPTAIGDKVYIILHIA